MGGTRRAGKSGPRAPRSIIPAAEAPVWCPARCLAQLFAHLPATVDGIRNRTGAWPCPERHRGARRSPRYQARTGPIPEPHTRPAVVGSFCVDAADIFTDPSAFPPFKIVEAGRIRPDMEQVFLRQSRLPGVVQMDLRAAISANTVTVHKIEGHWSDAMARTRSKDGDGQGGRRPGQALFLDLLRQIPDGTWSHRLYAEASHTCEHGAVPLRADRPQARRRADRRQRRHRPAGRLDQRDLRRTGGGLPVRARPRR